MTTDRINKDRKKAEKAAALLALAADESVEKGLCLGADEMAALVDGGTSQSELECFKLHISSCEKCYREWVLLKKIQEKSRGIGRVYHLSRYRKYSYIGSALAAAASVAVFLNIYYPQVGVEDKAAREPMIMEQASDRAMEQKLPPVEKQERYFEEREESVVVPSGSVTAESNMEVEPQRAEKMAAPAPRKQLLRKKSKELPAAAALQSRQVSQDEMAADVAAGRSGPAGFLGDSVDAWLKQIKQGCEDNNQDPDFWSRMRSKGEQLLSGQSELQNVIAEKVESVLLALTQRNKNNTPQQCQQILLLLGGKDEMETTKKPYK